MFVVRIGVTKEVPRRTRVAIHRIGLTLCRTATGWARGIDPICFACKHRLSITFWCIIFDRRQQYRQLIGRYGYRTILFAMNNRNRRAPIPLTAHQPVTHLVGYLCMTYPLLFEPRNDLLARFITCHSIKYTGMHQYAFVCEQIFFSLKPSQNMLKLRNRF